MSKLLKQYKECLLISLVIILAYRKLPSGYFQQDEWHSFGYYLYLSSLDFLGFLREILSRPIFSHLTPLSLLVKMSIFKIFALNSIPYFYISIVLHTSIVICLYFLLKKLTGNKNGAFLGTFFFALSSVHAQSVTWLGTFEGIEGSTLFGLISVILSLNYFSNVKNKKLWYLGLFSLLISLLFKEIGFVFLLFLAGLIILVKTKSKLKETVTLAAVPTSYLILKFSYLILGKSEAFWGVIENPQKLETFLGYNLTLVPKFFGQVFLPQEVFYRISSFLAGKFSGFLPDVNYIWQTHEYYIYDFLTIFFGLIVFFASFMFLKKDKTKLLFFYTFVIGSAATLLPLKKYIVYPDSRYFYTATLGGAALISFVLDKLEKEKRILLSRFVVLISLLLIAINFIYLEKRIEKEVEDGILRKRILSQVISSLPSLSEENLILADSDSMFYGLDDRILPFQSGFGQVLLVNYALSQKISPQFFTKEFLWDIQSEGYKKYENIGYGFFYNEDTLTKVLAENSLKIESVRGFSYSDSKKEITDITERVRGGILGRSKEEKEINLENGNVFSSQNDEDIYKIFDHDRTTFWSSGIPYYIPQSITIDLKRQRKIVELIIDSYDNKDQNEVGYELSISHDGNKWTQIFKDERRTPTKEGLVEIYLLPKLTRFVKILQIGYHKYAPWVIHELKVYESIN